jgi:hypothetical protein
MRWLQLALGLILAIAAGCAFGHACTARQELWWWVGTVALLSGLLLILSTIHASRRIELALRSSGGTAEWEGSAPLLGEILVSYSLISWDDLNRALAKQRTTRKRLGQILVDMRLITHAELAEVLEEQFSRRQLRRLRPAD